MMTSSKLLITVGTPIVSVLIYVLCIGYRKRSRIYHLRKQGVVSSHTVFVLRTCAYLLV